MSDEEVKEEQFGISTGGPAIVYALVDQLLFK